MEHNNGGLVQMIFFATWVILAKHPSIYLGTFRKPLRSSRSYLRPLSPGGSMRSSTGKNTNYITNKSWSKVYMDNVGMLGPAKTE